MSDTNYQGIEILLGKVLVSVEKSDSDDRITFTDSEGVRYFMFHVQDCCESVSIEDITGDLADLIGSPILKAEESTNSDNPKENADSHTWTFYHLATVNGYVTIRWYGSSNGCYSESVNFERQNSESFAQKYEGIA